MIWWLERGRSTEEVAEDDPPIGRSIWDDPIFSQSPSLLEDAGGGLARKIGLPLSLLSAQFQHIMSSNPIGSVMQDPHCQLSVNLQVPNSP